ncbi:MAG: DNA polymerase, partial [Deltaproteobacteria bacterium]
HHYGLVPSRVVCTRTEEKVLDSGVHLGSDAQDNADDAEPDDPSGFFALREVVRRHLGLELAKTERPSDWGDAKLTHEQVACAARDAAALLPLREVLRSKLIQEGLEATASLENQLIPCAADWWLAGVGVDLPRFEALVALRTGEALRLKQRVERALGIKSMDSDPKLLAALQRRGLSVTKTGAEALAPFAKDDSVVADLIAARRAMSFVKNAGKHVSLAARRYSDGRVRANMRTLAAPTGRMSASSPNMMGLSKAYEVRSCFVPAPGCVFVDADYAAIELRVLAQVTGDAMLAAIFYAKGDPHRALAARMTSKPETEVTGDERTVAKPINFGLAFGMGAETLIVYAMKNYGVAMTLAEAETARRIYQETFPQVALWHTRTARWRPREVRTIGGRRRLFAKPRESYCAVLNSPVQGTAADGMKQALVLMRARLAALGWRVVMVVHDEVLAEGPVAQAAQAKEIIEACMVEGMSMYVTDVPIVVEADIRATWAKERKS